MDRQAGRPGGGAQVSVLWFRVASWFKSELIEVLGSFRSKSVLLC